MIALESYLRLLEIMDRMTERYEKCGSSGASIHKQANLKQNALSALKMLYTVVMANKHEATIRWLKLSRRYVFDYTLWVCKQIEGSRCKNEEKLATEEAAATNWYTDKHLS